MRNQYKRAEIIYDFDTNLRTPCFTEKYFGEEKILTLTQVESILNNYSRDSEELKKQVKRNDSLTQRISQLRNDLEVSKSRETDDKAIRQVCQIIQDRIDFISDDNSEVDDEE